MHVVTELLAYRRQVETVKSILRNPSLNETLRLHKICEAVFPASVEAKPSIPSVVVSQIRVSGSSQSR